MEQKDEPMTEAQEDVQTPAGDSVTDEQIKDFLTSAIGVGKGSPKHAECIRLLQALDARDGSQVRDRLELERAHGILGRVITVVDDKPADCEMDDRTFDRINVVMKTVCWMLGHPEGGFIEALIGDCQDFIGQNGQAVCEYPGIYYKLHPEESPRPLRKPNVEVEVFTSLEDLLGRLTAIDAARTAAMGAQEVLDILGSMKEQKGN